MVFVDEKIRFSYDVYSLNRLVSQFDPLMRQQCSKILFNFSLTPSCDNI
ncbi:unnamed protein product [Brassica oleracea]